MQWSLCIPFAGLNPAGLGDGPHTDTQRVAPAKQGSRPSMFLCSESIARPPLTATHPCQDCWARGRLYLSVPAHGHSGPLLSQSQTPHRRSCSHCRLHCFPELIDSSAMATVKVAASLILGVAEATIRAPSAHSSFKFAQEATCRASLSASLPLSLLAGLLPAMDASTKVTIKRGDWSWAT